MNDTAVLEPELALHHSAPAPVETPTPIAPQPTISELLEEHLPHSQQKKIAVDNLSSIKFLVAPDGKSAVSAGEIKSDKHREIVEASLTAVLGIRSEDAPYLPPAEGIATTLGLASGGKFVEVQGAGIIKQLAEAGVRDFANALAEKREHSSHVEKLKLHLGENTPARA